MKKSCAFVTGVVVGAVACALLTPKTGRDLQDELIKKANELQKKAQDFELKDTKELIQGKLDETKKMIQHFDWKESKKKVEKKFEEVTERLNEIKAQLTYKNESQNIES